MANSQDVNFALSMLVRKGNEFDLRHCISNKVNRLVVDFSDFNYRSFKNNVNQLIVIKSEVREAYTENGSYLDRLDGYCVFNTKTFLNSLSQKFTQKQLIDIISNGKQVYIEFTQKSKKLYVLKRGELC